MGVIWTAEEEAARLRARFEGVNQARFARDHKVPGGPSMVNQHIHGRRPINMEHAIAYAKGFDVPLAEISPRLASQGVEASFLVGIEASRDTGGLREIAKRDDDIEISHWDTGGAMGAGVLLKDQPGVIQSWRVSPEWLQKNVRSCSAASNLVIVTGFGDSMRPMFNPGDPLLVDVGVQSIDFDAVYFFRVDEEGFIKRLQRIPGEGIRVLSANRDHYEPWTIKKGMDFQVFGRVLKVWCSEDF